jgi:hypothetical protein
MILEDVTLTEMSNGTYSYDDISRYVTVYVDYKSSYSKVDWYMVLTEDSIYSANANLNKTIFSKSNDTLQDVDINGLLLSSHYNMTESLFKSSVSYALEFAEKLLNDADIGVSLYDLGYQNY